MGVNPASYRKDHAATHPVSTNPICPPDRSTSQHINLQGRPDTRVSLLFFSPQPVCISKSHVANIAPFFFLFCYFSFAACLTRPDVPLWKHLQLDASLSGACHTHPSRLLQAGFLVISDSRSFSSEAALPAPPLSDHSRCITRLLSSRNTGIQTGRGSLTLSLSPSTKVKNSRVDQC